jgi:hypothetical protein
VPFYDPLIKPNVYRNSLTIERICNANIHSIKNGGYLIPTITKFHDNSSLATVSLIEKKGDCYKSKQIYYVANDIGLVNIRDKEIDLENNTYNPYPVSSYSPVFAHSKEADNNEPQMIFTSNLVKDRHLSKNKELRAGYRCTNNTNLDVPPINLDLNNKIYHFHEKDLNGKVNENVIKVFENQLSLNKDNMHNIVKGWQYTRITLKNGQSYLGMIKYHPEGFLYDVMILTYSGLISIIRQKELSVFCYFSLYDIFPINIELITVYPLINSFRIQYSHFATLNNDDLEKYNLNIYSI